MSDIPIPQQDIVEVIMTAINEVGGFEGASVDEIECYLKSTLNEAPDSESIQSSLNNAVAKGLLLEVGNGKYRINGSEEQTEAISESVNTDDKAMPSLHENDLNKARRLSDKITKYAKEKAQEAERAVEKASEDKNRNADSDVGNVSSVAEKEYVSVTLLCDDCKNKATARCEDDCKNKATARCEDDCKNKATSRCADGCAEKDVQKVERTVGKIAQDTKKTADSDTRNVGSSTAKEEKTKAQLSDDDDVKDIEKRMKDIKMKK